MPSSLTNLLYHAVFSTKERRAIITTDLRDGLYPYIGGIVRSEGGRLLAIGGTANHVHLLATFPPTVSVSEMMQRIKGNSSRWAGAGGTFGWQRGYAAFSVSESVAEAVRSYIEGQEEHHRSQTFEAEYLALLRKHGVVFDERYVWDRATSPRPSRALWGLPASLGLKPQAPSLRAFSALRVWRALLG